MDIATLQAFVAVAESGSFSVASERLYLTQPAISKRIAQLESELNSRLFDRIGRGVSLTESGQVLLPRARHILLEVEDSRREISNMSGQIAGRLRVGTSHHIGLHRLPPVLRRYSASYPEVELDLHFMDSEEVCRAVRHGDLELGVVTLPLDTPSELLTRTVWPDPLDFIVNPEHPLLTAAMPIDPIHLCEHAAILPAAGTYTREIIEQAFQPLSLTIPIRMATNYLETIKMMVSVGLGWSVLPRTMTTDDLRVLQVRNISLSRRLGVVWYGGRTLSNAAQAMLDYLPAVD